MRRFAFPMSCLLAATAAAQVTVVPVAPISHEGRVGEAPSNATVQYVLSNAGFSSVPYSVSWDPNAISDTPLRVNGSLSALQSGTIPSFGTEIVTISFAPTTKAAEGSHALVFTTPGGSQNRTHLLDIGTLELPNEIPVASYPPEAIPGQLTFAPQVHNSMPFAGNISIVSSDPSATPTQSSWTIPANSAAFLLVDVAIPANQTAARHSADLEFFDDDTGQSLGTRAVAYDYARYPSTAEVVIPDLGDVSSTIFVPDFYCLLDPNDPRDQVGVELELAHNSVQDLEVSLETPDGQVIYLHNFTGGGNSDLRLTYRPGTGDGPGDLSDLQGALAGGDWTLRVRDLITGDAGVLESWALLLPSKGENCLPRALDVEIEGEAFAARPLDLEVGSARPFHVQVDTLPPNGFVIDNGFVISEVPHILSTTNLEYAALEDGVATFEYSVVQDNGVSRTATATIRTGERQPLVYQSLDINPGWSTEGQWGYGVASGLDDPNTLLGRTVYGYNLSGDYENDMSPTHLTSTTFNLSNVVNAQLRFERLLQVLGYPFDHASISASRDGVTWETVWEHTGLDLLDSDFTQVTYDLSSFDGEPSVQIRWTMGATDTSGARTGWNIDEIEIIGIFEPCPGDVDGDQNVTLTDMAIVLANFGRSDATRFDGDLTGDGAVTLGDLAIVLQLFGEGC